MSVFPAVKVEIAFQNDPYATSPVWTDVTRYVRGEVTVKRGRNYELTKTEAGTASFTLENTDGRFSPLNTASPYAPYVLPFRPVRITGYDGTSIYPVFRGFVERWPQTWDSAGNYGTVSVAAVDAMKTVLLRTLGQPYATLLVADNAYSSYALDNTTDRANATHGSESRTVGSSTTFAASTTGGLPAQAAGGKTTLTATAAVASSGVSSAANIVVAGGGNVRTSYELWWKPASVPATNGLFLQLIGTGSGATAGNGPSVIATFDAAGARYTVKVNATTYTASTAVVPTAGRTDHVVLRYATAGTLLELIVNGTTILSQSLGVNTPSFSSPVNVAGYYNLPSGFVADFSDVSSYALTLSDTTVAQHYLIGTTRPQNFLAQTAGVRIGLLLDAVGWPTALRSVATGLSTLQATGAITGASALAVLQAAADDELGNVFIDGQGRVVFQDRAARNSATPVRTFGEAAAEVPYIDGVTIDFDDTYIYNDVEVTQAGPSAAFCYATDASSQTTYGLRVLTRTTAVQSTNDVQGQADTLLARYKQPVARLSQLPVDIKANPSAIATVMGLDLGQLVTVARRPLGAPAMSLDVWIDGIEDRISTTSWKRTFLLTPKFANSTY